MEVKNPQDVRNVKESWKHWLKNRLDIGHELRFVLLVLCWNSVPLYDTGNMQLNVLFYIKMRLYLLFW